MYRAYHTAAIVAVLTLLLVCPARGQTPPAGGKQSLDRNKPIRADCYGDPLPPRVLARLGTVRLRDGDNVTQIAFSAKGQTLASASRHGPVRLWEAATGKEIRRIAALDHPADPYVVYYFALSPDGSFLVSGFGTDNLHIWDVATGTKLRSLKNPGSKFDRVAVSPDGKLIAAAGDHQLFSLWETATGRHLHSVDRQGTSSFSSTIAFSPDSGTLAVGSNPDRTIQLWDVTTATEFRRISLPRPGPAKEDGRIWPPTSIKELSFSPDGKILACCGGLPEISLWDPSTGKEIRRLPGVGLGNHHLAISPDGRMLASGFDPGLIRLWDMSTYQQRQEFLRLWYVTGVAFSPDGKTLAASVGPAIRLWDVHTGRETIPDRGHIYPLRSCSLHSDQRTLITATADGSVRRWELATGKELSRVAVPLALERVTAISPDGSTAACFHGDPKGPTMDLWDLAAQKKHAIPCSNNAAPIFSPDGKLLLIRDYRAQEKGWVIRACDVATGKELPVVARNDRGITNIELSPDGKLLAAALFWEKAHIVIVRVLDVATGQELCRVPVDKDMSGITDFALALSPNNKLLALSGEWGGSYRSVHLWDLDTGKKLRQFGRSRGGYSALAFSPDSRTLATGAQDKRIRLWEVATGSERLVLEGHGGPVLKLLFAENGQTLVSTSNDTTALVWDLTGLRAQTGLAQPKRNPSDVQNLWTDLADTNAAKAYQAIWRLAATPSLTVTFLREHLHPIARPDGKTLERLIADLDSPAFLVREKATQELSNFGQSAEPAMRKALASERSPEVQYRIQQIIKHLEQAEALPSAEQLQTLRAVEVLEMAGTPEARRMLEALSKGAPGARLTQEAEASVERLVKRRFTGA